jgi:hypothetical protein
MSTPIPPAPKREFDSIVSANVKIKKVSDNEYEITLVSNVSKVLVYQVWSPISPALNNDRKVFELKAIDWVNSFFKPTSVFAPVVSFTPTCVMELGKCKYVFIINDAKVKYINDCRKVVFRVSSEDINVNNKNKVIKKIPITKKGELFHARFDIDPSSSTSESPQYPDPSGFAVIASIFDQQIIDYYINNNTFNFNFPIVSWNMIPSSDGGSWVYIGAFQNTAPFGTNLSGINITVSTTVPNIQTLLTNSYYDNVVNFNKYFVIKFNSSNPTLSNVYIGSYIQPAGTNANKYSDSIPQEFELDYNSYLKNNNLPPAMISSFGTIPRNFIGDSIPFPGFGPSFAWVQSYRDGSKPDNVTFYSVNNNAWLNTSTATIDGSPQIPVVRISGSPNGGSTVGVNSVYNSEYNCWTLSFYTYITPSSGGYFQGSPVDYNFNIETNTNPNYTCMGYYPTPQGLYS